MKHPYEDPIAAIEFSLHTDEGPAFLKAWQHGMWEEIDREWPEFGCKIVGYRNTLIGLTGRIFSGKSHIADILSSIHGYELYEMSSPGYAALRALGVSEEYFEPKNRNLPMLEFGNKSVRQLTQSLLQDWGRNMVCQNIWVTAARMALSKKIYYRKKVVIPGIRQQNEVDFIKSNGGILIHIDRPIEEMPAASDHAVEKFNFRDQADKLIFNSSVVSAAQLSLNIKEAIRKTV